MGWLTGRLPEARITGRSNSRGDFQRHPRLRVLLEATETALARLPGPSAPERTAAAQ